MQTYNTEDPSSPIQCPPHDLFKGRQGDREPGTKPQFQSSGYLNPPLLSECKISSKTLTGFRQPDCPNGTRGGFSFYRFWWCQYRVKWFFSTDLIKSVLFVSISCCFVWFEFVRYPEFMCVSINVFWAKVFSRQFCSEGPQWEGHPITDVVLNKFMLLYILRYLRFKLPN